MYIRNRRFNNIKGSRPPDPPESPETTKTGPNVPNVPVSPYPISAYKHNLNLTSYGLNRYEIKCVFYNNYNLYIDMDVYDKNNSKIATNVFHNNTWKTENDGYTIIYDNNLLTQVKNAPLPCSLDTHIKYITSPSKREIFVTESASASS